MAHKKKAHMKKLMSEKKEESSMGMSPKKEMPMMKKMLKKAGRGR